MIVHLGSPMVPRPVVAAAGHAVMSSGPLVARVIQSAPPSFHLPENVRQPSTPTLSKNAPQLSVMLGPKGATSYGGGSSPSRPTPNLPAPANPVSGGYIPSASDGSAVPSAVPFTPPANATPDASPPDGASAGPDGASASVPPSVAASAAAAEASPTTRGGIPVAGIVIGVLLIAGGASFALSRKKKR